MTQLSLVGGTYQTTISVQECVNLYPEVAEQGGRNKGSLRGAPGLSTFSSPGSGPIRGFHEMDGVGYVVSGQSLYSFSASGAAVSLGAIVGSVSVGMAHNIASQLMITTGSTAYIYSVADGLVEITDEDFPGADVVYYMDTYFVVNVPNTQEFAISNSGSGIDWTATDFASKEGAPNNLVTLIPNHLDLFLFGEKTYEVWRNTGDSDFAFERSPGTFQERGCGARFSVASLDNTVYFLGDDKIVYKIDGYAPVRISDHGLERAIANLDVSNATAFTYTDNGHYFYCLNVSGDTYVYDATFSAQSGRTTWHTRRTGIGSGRWRAQNYINIYNKHLVGDYTLGKIWQMSESTYTDNGAAIERVRSMVHLYAEANPVSVSRIELRMRTGVGNAAVTDPQIWLEISRDGGKTFSERRLRSMGKAGEYAKQIIWSRNGRARDWIFRLTTTEACPVVMYEMYAHAEVGEG